MQKTKDVTIGEVEYQIGRINPLDGSYIIQLLLRTVLPDFMAKAMQNAAEGGELPMGKGRPMTREEMREIQIIALNVCRKYKHVGGQKVAIPITANDQLVDDADGLHEDIGSVMALSAQSLMFSVVSPFFADDGLKKLLPQGMASAFNPSNTPHSQPTHTAR